ncbi:hypothetical protein [Syntrophorhabdus aromaticivorans]|uniref:hypothetical protein n=1 Tax=Syntrophorhabdus aromaticivorans TaxID=328301 RepID=UPI00042103C7|nr:hypothetical protein [Syntrophorhabdus aromaticivorans]
MSLAKDNFSINLRFSNGDLGTITYTGQGSAKYGKELIEVFDAGRVFVIDDFKGLHSYGLKKDTLSSTKQDKGFKTHQNNFFESVRGNARLITTVDDGVRVTQIIERVIHKNSGAPCR